MKQTKGTPGSRAVLRIARSHERTTHMVSGAGEVLQSDSPAIWYWTFAAVPVLKKGGFSGHVPRPRGQLPAGPPRSALQSLQHYEERRRHRRALVTATGALM